MISCPVTIEVDLTMGACLHQTLNPAQMFPPPGIPTPAVEMLINMNWSPGTNSHKFTEKIFHKANRIVQEGHDCGIFIPDFTPMCMVNFFYLISWPTSKRVVTFGASTVKFGKLNAGCTFFYFPMLTCGQPFSLPLSFPLSNWLNNVYVGMTLSDLLAGLIQIGISMLIDAIFNKIGGKGWSGLKDVPLKSLVSKKAAQEAANKVFLKEALSALAEGKAVPSVGQTLMNAAIDALGFGSDLKGLGTNMLKNALSGLSGFVPGFLGHQSGKLLNIGSPYAGFSLDYDEQSGGYKPSGSLLTFPLRG